MNDYLATTRHLVHRFYESRERERVPSWLPPHSKKVVPRAIGARQQWFDRHGLLTQIPGPHFFDAIVEQGMAAFGSNRFIGTYTAPYSRNLDLIDGQLTLTQVMDGGGDDAKPVPGDAIYRFSISNQAIHQELDHDRLFILESDGSARIMGADHGVETILAKVLVPKDPDQPELGYTPQYVATAYRAIVPIRKALEHIPATIYDYLDRFGDAIYQLVSSLGYREEIEEAADDWENHRFYWTLRLKYEANDPVDPLRLKHGEVDPSQKWLTAVPDGELIHLWNGFVNYKNHLLSMAKASRLDPTRHAAQFSLMQGINDQVLAALDKRFPNRR